MGQLNEGEEEEEERLFQKQQRRFNCFFFDSLLILLWSMVFGLVILSVLYSIPGFRPWIESYFDAEFSAMLTGNGLVGITAYRVLSNYEHSGTIMCWTYLFMQLFFRIGIHFGLMYTPTNIYVGTFVPAAILAMLWVPLLVVSRRLKPVAYKPRPRRRR